eukprot:jgi/Ulvmu1/11103/UM070_0019.1
MVSERVEALLVPKFLRLVACGKADRVSLDDLKRTVQAKRIQFPADVLVAMFAEADFRMSGRLSAPELVAAVSGRYPKRKYTEAWKELLSLVLQVPRPQLDCLMQPRVLCKRPTTTVPQGSKLSRCDLEPPHEVSSTGLAWRPQWSTQAVRRPHKQKSTVRPASASVTLQSGKTLTGNAALFEPGGLLQGLVQGPLAATVVTFNDARVLQQSVAQRQQPRPQTAPPPRQSPLLTESARRRVACMRPRTMLRPASPGQDCSADCGQDASTMAERLQPSSHLQPHDARTASVHTATAACRRGDPAIDHATLTVPPELHAKAQARPVPPEAVHFGSAALPVQPVCISALDTLRSSIAVPPTQPAFARRFRALRACQKQHFLGEQLDTTRGSGFALCNTPPVADTRLSKFVDGYIAWRQVRCWTRADVWDTWAHRRVATPTHSHGALTEAALTAGARV